MTMKDRTASTAETRFDSPHPFHRLRTLCRATAAYFLSSSTDKLQAARARVDDDAFMAGALPTLLDALTGSAKPAVIPLLAESLEAYLQGGSCSSVADEAAPAAAAAQRVQAVMAHLGGVTPTLAAKLSVLERATATPPS